MMIQYRVKPGRSGENQEAIRRVFAELHAQATPGVRYVVFTANDGLSFTHLVSLEADGADNPLLALPAFQAFQAGVIDRWEAPPVTTILDEVASYRVFDA
jgi:hypothetical protein